LSELKRKEEEIKVEEDGKFERKTRVEKKEKRRGDRRGNERRRGGKVRREETKVGNEIEEKKGNRTKDGKKQERR